MKPGRNRPIMTIVAAVLVISVVAAILNQTGLIAVFGRQRTGPVSIKSQGFVPVDTNQTLARTKARLIVVEDFHATKLNNNRSLHIYLPPSYYQEPASKFPVLYVQDGKSVFDISDWSKESLDMHTTADRLIAERKISELIIVGIDNIGEARTSEYAHWDGVDMGQPVTGQGVLYEDFVVNEVKPFVDSNFRTLSDAENTALMGASIGGFATFNIGYRNPDKFSKLAMLSPYLGWGDNRLYQELKEGSYKEKRPLKMWIDVGSTEQGFIEMAALGIQALLGNGYRYGNDLVAYEAPQGEHSERFWAERIEPILLYFYGDIGEPQSVTLFCDQRISLGGQYIGHINAVATYTSGFKLTDLFGSYQVEKPELLKVEALGGALLPLAEGSTKVSFTSSTGLTTETTITVGK